MIPPPNTLAAVAVEHLAANGISTLYCLPGVHNDELLTSPSLSRLGIKTVHCRHEQGCGYMALGAAMATGRPQALSIIPGPGLLNAAAALATARSTFAPVVAMVGQIASSSMGKQLGDLHEIVSQTTVVQSLTKWSTVVRLPSDSHEAFTTAFRFACSGRPGPAAIEVPYDLWTAPIAPRSVLPAGRAELPALDDDELARAVNLLLRARRPLIVVGGGAQDASDETRTLAELLRAPVLANRMGKGVLDSDHPLSVTLPEGHSLWGATDVVVAAGTRMRTPSGWGLDEKLSIIRIDVDQSEFARSPRPAAAICGDVATVLRELANRLQRTLGRRPDRTDEIAACRASVARRMTDLQPQVDMLRAIRAELPPEGIFVEELTQIGYVSRLAFPVHRPRTFLSPGHQGTLGFGFPAAIGAQIARPGLPVVAIAGDGGLLFAIQELATAVHFRVPVVTVVFNDRAYGNVRRARLERRLPIDDCELTNPDFVRLAESFGALGLRASGAPQLQEAVRLALKTSVPTLIEVPLPPLPSPWPLLHLPRVRPLR